MKKIFYPVLLIALAVIVVSSCKDEVEDLVRFALYSVDGTEVEATDVSLAVTQNGNQTENTLTLNGKDGSTVILKFMGDTAGAYDITMPENGIYIDPNNKQFQAENGTIGVIEYKQDGGKVSINGGFDFNAINTTDSSTVSITDGVLTNVSNQ